MIGYFENLLMRRRELARRRELRRERNRVALVDYFREVADLQERLAPHSSLRAVAHELDLYILHLEEVEATWERSHPITVGAARA